MLNDFVIFHGEQLSAKEGRCKTKMRVIVFIHFHFLKMCHIFHLFSITYQNNMTTSCSRNTAK